MSNYITRCAVAIIVMSRIGLAESAFAQSSAAPPLTPPPAAANAPAERIGPPAHALAPPLGSNSSDDPAVALVNQAHQMNTEQQALARLVLRKAGDDQSLMAFARHLRDDHRDNDETVRGLAARERIHLPPVTIQSATERRLAQTRGSDFPDVFLDEEIRDQANRIESFKNTRMQLRDNRDATTYIDQTLPIMRAHVRMAQDLRTEIGRSHTQASTKPGSIEAPNASKPMSAPVAPDLRLVPAVKTGTDPS